MGNAIFSICLYSGFTMALSMWHCQRFIPALTKWENRAKFGFWFGYFAAYYSL